MNKHRNKRLSQAWVVSVDMGYGHERAAFGLRDLTYGQHIIANNYPGIPKSDKKIWVQSERFYTGVSRLKAMPVIGNFVFDFYDNLQEIPTFYPRRDLSRPNLQVRELYHLIRHRNFGRHLIDTLRKRAMPLVTTFFMPAFAAEVHGYPGEIYVVICDADCSRTWAPLDPKQSRINYFAPNGRVVERLKLYGVPEKNIFLSGFPISKVLIDGPDASILKKDLSRRLYNLDPKGIFHNEYGRTIKEELGYFPPPKRRSLTVTFAVGGAGAQQSLGVDILESLSVLLARREINLVLAAGTHRSARDLYVKQARRLKLSSALGKNLKILYADNLQKYFMDFTRLLRTTDVLWTKPSELSFYTGGGLPIIIAPPIGSQEDFNALWLQTVGGGLHQLDPKYTSEWLFDWVNSGGLARAAWNGYMEAPTHGAYRIQSVITDEKFPLSKLPLIV